MVEDDDVELDANLESQDLSTEQTPPDQDDRTKSPGTVALPAAGRWLLARLAPFGVTVIAGLLLCASFPPFDWWWAAILAFALLAWVLTRRATTPAGGLGYGFVFGLAFYLPLLPWVSTLVGTPPWIVLAVVCAAFPAFFGLLAVAVRQLPGWPIWFSVLWAAQEWAKSTVPFGGFPWGVVGFGQTKGPLLPLAQLGGLPLLSAAIVLLGCSATAIAVEIVASGLRGRCPHSGSNAEDAQHAKPPAVVLPGIAICFVLFAVVAFWPHVRHSGMGSGDDPVVTVAAIQGNVPRLGFDFNGQRRAVLDNHVRETLRLADDVRAGTAPKPEFVIWPEDSSDIDPLTNPDAAAQISLAAKAIGVPILVGTVLDVPGLVLSQSADNPDYTNTVIVWDPVSGPGERHDKQIVQPFGEYLPWPWLFRHLSGYADRAGHMVPGTSTGVVHPAGIPVGIATCWEVIFDRALRESVLHGAQMLVVPSNNATFNKTMSEQQLVFARARAVEHDRYVVVAGTTGISAVIAPDGGELVRTDFFQPAYLDTQLRLKTSKTAATRWGPVVQWLFAGMGVAALLVAIRHNGWFPRRNRRRLRSADDAKAPTGGSADALPDDGDEQAPPDDGADDDTPPAEGRPTRSPFSGRQRSHMTTGQSTPAGKRPSQRTLVIIPTFNEKENLPLILGRLHEARPDVHVLVVDDDSPDGTGQLADQLAAAQPDRMHVLHRTAKDGLGAAYLAGFGWGLAREYSVMVEMDADGSHAPEQLHRLLDAVDAGADLAIGSRYIAGGMVRNWPRRRKVLSKTANTYSRLMLGIDVHDITAGYRAYRREVLQTIDLGAVSSKGYCFQIDLTWRTIHNGFVVVEVPITFTERTLGVSKMDGSTIREAVVKVAQWGIHRRVDGGPPRAALTTPLNGEQ